jgi:hypothetical protein
MWAFYVNGVEGVYVGAKDASRRPQPFTDLGLYPEVQLIG